jgi:hypothetical protein
MIASGAVPALLPAHNRFTTQSGLCRHPDARVRPILSRTYVNFPSLIWGLTWGYAPDRGFGFWLREPDRDGRAEQVERTSLDRGHGGNFLDLLPSEIE